MKYIINHMIIPRIEYKAQLNIFNEVQINKINSQIRSMFKQKTNLVRSIPNVIIHSKLGYDVTDYSKIQLKRQMT